MSIQSRRLRVGLSRHIGSEQPETSLDTLFSDLTRATAQFFDLQIPWSIPILPFDRRAAYWARFLADLDVLVTDNHGLVALRARCGAKPRIMFLALGGLPRGGARVRQALGGLTGQDVIAFTSSADQKIFRLLVKRGGPRPVYLPPPVDSRMFGPLEESARRDLRRQYGLGERDVLFIYTGRITAEKNVHTLLGVMETVIARHPCVHLLIAGPAQDTPFRQFSTGPFDVADLLARQIRESPHLRTNVRTLGTIRRSLLPLALGIADVFINLTVHHDENFGYSQVEAMACGLPIVCSDWGGLKDTVVNSVCGIRIPVRTTGRGVHVDKPAALEACLRLVDDSHLRRRMGKSGRRRATSEYSFERFASRYHAGLGSEAPPDAELAEWTSFGREFQASFCDKLKERAAVEPTFNEQTYGLYRNLIGPYATSPGSALLRVNGQLYPNAQRLHVEAGRICIDDPLWPVAIGLTAIQQTLLRTLLGELREKSQVAIGVRELRVRHRSLSMRAFRRAIEDLLVKGVLGCSMGLEA
jgi:glycosyltransferase involved in cell wall biosynthesis